MNSNIDLLYTIANKQSRNIIGLMSGTSLDGLDIALCEIRSSGKNSAVKLRQFKTVPYPSAVKTEIRKVFAKQQVNFQDLCLLNPWIANLHASYINECLEEWSVDRDDVDLIASHGQTVYHSPKILHGKEGFPNATLQIGDGDHIAVGTGIITVSDFRQKHLAGGGEGAPLALYGDYCIFMKEGENRIMLNMGGIANFTYLPGDGKPSGIFVTDTGPGNTIIDAFSQELFNQDFDKDAIHASRGRVNEKLLRSLKEDVFFSKSFPRTTGPELFNKDYVSRSQQQSGTSGISGEDLLATLTQFSADTIIDALRQVIGDKQPFTIYASGGGAHNPLLMKKISQAFAGVDIRRTDELGIPGDAKEAVLFAILANETVAGAPINFGDRDSMPAVTMGKISFPG